MSWKEMNFEALAKSWGVSPIEVREKQRLMKLIVELRKKKKMTQVQLAKLLKISQSRVAQIESGIGTSKISFDVLLKILTTLGWEFVLKLCREKYRNYYAGAWPPCPL